MQKVRAVVYGVGQMGSLATRMLLEKDVEIVGALARSDAKVGKDLGEVAGLGRSLGVTVGSDADAVLAEANADIALLAVDSYLADHAVHLEACAKSGTNAITLSEEALYPWRTAADATKRLDQLAKDHGVTLTGGGCQDLFWVHQVGALMGAAHTIESVYGYSNWNVDDFGPEVAQDMQIGAAPEDISSSSGEDQDGPPSFNRIGLEAIVALAGLTFEKVTSEVEPLVATEPTPSNGLGTTIEAGRVVGLNNVERVQTAEGIELTLEMAGHIYKPGEHDVTEWTIKGEPDMKVRIDPWPARIGTVTQLVNRVPDVINAAPGFVTVDQLPAPMYRSAPMGAYIREQ